MIVDINIISTYLYRYNNIYFYGPLYKHMGQQISTNIQPKPLRVSGLSNSSWGLSSPCRPVIREAPPCYSQPMRRAGAASFVTRPRLLQPPVLMGSVRTVAFVLVRDIRSPGGQGTFWGHNRWHTLPEFLHRGAGVWWEVRLFQEQLFPPLWCCVSDKPRT